MAVDDVQGANQLAVLLHLASGGGINAPTTSTGTTGMSTGTSTDYSQLGQNAIDAATQPATQPSATADSATAPSVSTTSDSGTMDPVPQGTPVSQGYGVNGHPGIDLGVPLNTQLVAAQSGTVTHASNDDPGGYGEWVEITTADGYKIRYGHLHSASVNVGDSVKAGQVIGTSGGEAGGATSGNSTGAHLHFEVRGPDGNTVDPTPWLAGGHAVVDANPSQITVTPASPDAQMGSAIANIEDVAAGKQASHTAQGAAAPADQSQQGQTQDSGNFANDVLTGIGAPVTPENVRAIEAWMRAEGGASHNNPLNTTQGAAGASDFNSVGVKTYTSYEQGVQATIQTLLNGYYGNIIAALKQGNNAMAVANAIADSPWGTGGLVKEILGGK